MADSSTWENKITYDDSLTNDYRPGTRGGVLTSRGSDEDLKPVKVTCERYPDESFSNLIHYSNELIELRGKHPCFVGFHHLSLDEREVVLDSHLFSLEYFVMTYPKYFFFTEKEYKWVIGGETHMVKYYNFTPTFLNTIRSIFEGLCDLLKRKKGYSKLSIESIAFESDDQSLTSPRFLDMFPCNYRGPSDMFLSFSKLLQEVISKFSGSEEDQGQSSSGAQLDEQPKTSQASAQLIERPTPKSRQATLDSSTQVTAPVVVGGPTQVAPPVVVGAQVSNPWLRGCLAADILDWPKQADTLGQKTRIPVKPVGGPQPRKSKENRRLEGEMHPTLSHFIETLRGDGLARKVSSPSLLLKHPLLLEKGEMRKRIEFFKQHCLSSLNYHHYDFDKIVCDGYSWKEVARCFPHLQYTLDFNVEESRKNKKVVEYGETANGCLLMMRNTFAHLSENLLKKCNTGSNIIPYYRPYKRNSSDVTLLSEESIEELFDYAFPAMPSYLFNISNDKQWLLQH